jgi:hypothetical protein
MGLAEQIDELINAESGMAEDRAERPSVQGFVIWNDHLCEG